jgi:hypothetical protein
MMDVFNETLRGWQYFYFMAGGAAAALIGLMFVALSLGMGVLSRMISDEAKAFVTPSVIYFVTVLFIACVMLVPTATPSLVGVLVGGAGVLGLGQTFRHVRSLIRAAKRNQDFTLFDWITQVILPLGMYASLVVVMGALVMSQWDAAFMVLWAASVLLLICAVSNTWSLVVWIVEQRPS